jgi:hypothetical protein
LLQELEDVRFRCMHQRTCVLARDGVRNDANAGWNAIVIMSDGARLWTAKLSPYSCARLVFSTVGPRITAEVVALLSALLVGLTLSRLLAGLLKIGLERAEQRTEEAGVNHLGTLEMCQRRCKYALASERQPNKLGIASNAVLTLVCGAYAQTRNADFAMK